MAFATNADRTNTVAAALTVMLHRHWPGQKPVIRVTANRSHSGKGTVSDFFRGSVPKADLLYEGTTGPCCHSFSGKCRQALRLAWSIRQCTLRQFWLQVHPVGLHRRLRYHRRIDFIIPRCWRICPPYEPFRRDDQHERWQARSRPYESGVIDPFGSKGDVHDKETAIGNPKLDYLPANRDQIEAELRGMIERWKEAGRPLDETVRHSMTPWAKTIGGILVVNGFKDFLGNAPSVRCR